MITKKSITKRQTNKITIYKITNYLGDIYIGVTSNIEHRINTYKRYPKVFKNQKLLYQSITKYGWNKHKVTILETYESETLNLMEVTMLEQKHIHNEYMNDPSKLMNITIIGLSRDWNKKII